MIVMLYNKEGLPFWINQHWVIHIKPRTKELDCQEFIVYLSNDTNAVLNREQVTELTKWYGG
jgi:hypothetical protein